MILFWCLSHLFHKIHCKLLRCVSCELCNWRILHAASTCWAQHLSPFWWAAVDACGCQKHSKRSLRFPLLHCIPHFQEGKSRFGLPKASLQPALWRSQVFCNHHRLRDAFWDALIPTYSNHASETFAESSLFDLPSTCPKVHWILTGAALLSLYNKDTQF